MKTAHHEYISLRASRYHWNLTELTSGGDLRKHSYNLCLHTSRSFIVLEIFPERRVSLQDDAHPGDAHCAITSAVIAEVGLIRGNRWITVEELHHLVGISHGSVHVTVTKHLHYRKICVQ
ncbi:hypothetical protein ANN_24150 [Periplaneta americana]|uniref:Uncharacterized protein n=1 Tax=Periplaneta americana TaxID=6978 RepID=A0ABQ8S2T6_PERAM|nr:hypothetical protein ANN_24150 [Periplaneta americana]